MLIKVLKTITAATDQSGCKTKEYKKDSIEDIYNELAEVFIAEGWGESIIEEKSIEDIENKVIKEEEIEDKSIKEEEIEKKVIKEDKIDNKSFLQKTKNSLQKTKNSLQKNKNFFNKKKKHKK